MQKAGEGCAVSDGDADADVDLLLVDVAAKLAVFDAVSVVLLDGGGGDDVIDALAVPLLLEPSERVTVGEGDTLGVTDADVLGDGELLLLPVADGDAVAEYDGVGGVLPLGDADEVTLILGDEEGEVLLLGDNEELADADGDVLGDGDGEGGVLKGLYGGKTPMKREPQQSTRPKILKSLLLSAGSLATKPFSGGMLPATHTMRREFSQDTDREIRLADSNPACGRKIEWRYQGPLGDAAWNHSSAWRPLTVPTMMLVWLTTAITVANSVAASVYPRPPLALRRGRVRSMRRSGGESRTSDSRSGRRAASPAGFQRYTPLPTTSLRSPYSVLSNDAMSAHSFHGGSANDQPLGVAGPRSM